MSLSMLISEMWGIPNWHVHDRLPRCFRSEKTKPNIPAPTAFARLFQRQLRAIRLRKYEEDMLRGLVTRKTCI